MAYDLRNHRVSYDNIAVGSAVSAEENHSAVAEDPIAEVYGGGSNVAAGSAAGEENSTVAVDPCDEIPG